MPNTELQKYIDHNRTLHVAEAVKVLGISAPSIYRLIKEEGLERISKGVYAYPDTWLDEMKLLSERSDLALAATKRSHGVGQDVTRRDR